MVIPNLPLPIAGNVTPSQSAGPPVAGDGEGATTTTGESGGLFAALLAALEGVAEDTAVASSDTNLESGEEALAIPLLVTTESEAETEDDAVELLAESVVATEGDILKAVVLAASGSLDRPAEVGVSTLPSVKPQPPVQIAPTVLAERPVQLVGDAAQQVPANVDPLAQVGRPVNVEELAVARASVPVDADAVPETAPPTSKAPLLTGVKGPVTLVQTAPAEQTAQVAQSAPQADYRPLETTGPAAPQRTDVSTAVAKSEPDSPVPIDFEKAKQSLSVLRAAEESPSTPLRKAIEAFAKPVAGHSDGVANTPRPQPPAFIPVTAGDSANAPVADVSRVAPTIAPAELGPDAPRTVATPETPDRPTRTTMHDIGQTAVRSIRYLARNGEHRMTLRLIPESLGEVKIEVLSTKEALTVKLVAESAVVRDAMEAQVHHLRDSLSREGIEVKSITVSEDSGSGRSAFNHRDANTSRNGERGQSQSGEHTAPDQSSGRNAKYTAPRARHDGAFDQVA